MVVEPYDEEPRWWEAKLVSAGWSIQKIGVDLREWVTKRVRHRHRKKMSRTRKANRK